MTKSDDQIAKLSELLHEAAETHHVVYRIVDGDDPDWASWYADWLLDLSELPELLGGKPVRSHLVHALVQLDRDYTRRHKATVGKTPTLAHSRCSSGTDPTCARSRRFLLRATEPSEQRCF